MEETNPQAEVLNVVDFIKDGKRADAIDAVNDILFSRAADAMGSYKQTVANTYFDEPVGEAQPNETDNGTD